MFEVIPVRYNKLYFSILMFMGASYGPAASDVVDCLMSDSNVWALPNEIIEIIVNQLASHNKDNEKTLAGQDFAKPSMIPINYAVLPHLIYRLMLGRLFCTKNELIIHVKIARLNYSRMLNEGGYD